jgi:hypothetical protein
MILVPLRYVLYIVFTFLNVEFQRGSAVRSPASHIISALFSSVLKGEFRIDRAYLQLDLLHDQFLSGHL